MAVSDTLVAQIFVGDLILNDDPTRDLAITVVPGNPRHTRRFGRRQCLAQGGVVTGLAEDSARAMLTELGIRWGTEPPPQTRPRGLLGWDRLADGRG